MGTSDTISGSLFATSGARAASVGLPRRLRPTCLDEYVGQKHILGPGKLLRRAVESDRLFSMILYGPPGIGKTSLGNVIANATGSIIVSMNAVEAGVADLRREVAQAGLRERRRTILFIDEIHRFNKAQQDVLLAPLENDLVVMIGATVENPFFYLNQALLSRVQVFELVPLSEDELREVLERALMDREKGLGEYVVEMAGDALEHFVVNSLGDARKALGALELAVLSTAPDRNGVIKITADVAFECLRTRVARYDRGGDSHYDIASAFIKSIRGSQPDAALHWMARMIAGGEDPRFIARRLVISAAEDVGLADPAALGIAVSAARAAEMLGSPESAYPLAEAVVYLATAPKSRACADAIAAASGDVEEGHVSAVPEHLKSAGYRGAGRLRPGEGYAMPVSEAEGRKQVYVNIDRVYYRPGETGYEREVRERLASWDGVRPESPPDGGQE